MTKEQDEKRAGEEISKRFMAKHPDFRASKSMSDSIGEWFKKNDAPFNEQNLEFAYSSVTRPISTEEFVAGLFSGGVKV